MCIIEIRGRIDKQYRRDIQRVMVYEYDVNDRLTHETWKNSAGRGDVGSITYFEFANIIEILNDPVVGDTQKMIHTTIFGPGGGCELEYYGQSRSIIPSDATPSHAAVYEHSCGSSER